MAESKSKKTETSKKIVDVKSGGDGATGTSRPVIVTNRPILKDPMMAEVSQLTGGALDDSQTPIPTGDPGTEAPSGAPEVKVTKKVAIKVDGQKEAEPAEAPAAAEAPSKKKLVIKPLDEKTSVKSETKAEPEPKTPTIAELALPDAEEVPDVDVKPEEPVLEEKVEEPAATEPAADEEKQPEAEEDSSASGVQPGRSFDETEQANKDAAGQVPGAEQVELDAKGKPKTKEKSTGELTKEQQKAIDNGEYFLPITTAETRRLRREIVFATLFVAILIVVWLDIMLDAGLLELGGIKAVTNFF